MDILAGNRPSYDTSCRICLMANPDVISLFQHRNSVNVFEEIMFCTNVIIEKDDNLPSNICNTCLNELDIAAKFKRKCEYSDQVLKEACQSQFRNELKVDTCDVNFPNDTTSHFSCSSDSLTDEECTPLNELVKTNKKSFFQKISCDSITTDKECNDVNKTLLDDSALNQKEFEKIIENTHIPKERHKNIAKKQKHSSKEMPSEFKCETCSLLCQSKWILKVHMRTHSGDRPFECDVCLKRFVSNSNMRMHKRLTHGEEKQVCSDCGKSFSCLTYLKRHQVTHLEVKPFPCPLCPRRFSSNSYLKEHEARHRGDKRFFCELCGARFISDVNLKQHMVTHSVRKWDFKRHQCTFCEYRTTGRVALARHIRKHTGERPFLCPHEGCSSAFAGKASLNLHIRIHTGEKPYSCSECLAKFSRGDKFKNHMFKKHNINLATKTRSKLVIEELIEIAP